MMPIVQDQMPIRIAFLCTPIEKETRLDKRGLSSTCKGPFNASHIFSVVDLDTDEVAGIASCGTGRV